LRIAHICQHRRRVLQIRDTYTWNNIFNGYKLVGDLRDEDEVLHWLLHQKEADEIEDVSEEMLQRLIRETTALAVLFCE